MEQSITPEVALDLTASSGHPPTPEAALRAIDAAFSAHRHADALDIALPASLELIGLPALALPSPTPRDSGQPAGTRYRVCHSDFLQFRPAWLPEPRMPRDNDAVSTTGAIAHPTRPPRPTGLVYRRHLDALDSEISLRGLDAERDQAALHAWMNNERVNAYWGMKGPPEVHRQLLAALLADPHAQPLIGEFDGHAFGYFDVYWAKEDKVGRCYDAADHDRGLHMLVGDEQFRGPHRVAAWLGALVHYAFLDEPRTDRLVCEPRIDNRRMIDYLLRFGFTAVGPIELPNKQALLLSLTRDAFLQRGLRTDFQPATD